MTLFVAHINEQATEDDLRKLFEPFGAITEIDKKRTYAFIGYDDIASIDAAIKALHNTEFMGSKLRVEVSNKTRGNDGPSLGDLQEQCYHCKEIGHIAKNCPQLQLQQQQQQSPAVQLQKPRQAKQIATSANESLYMQMFSQTPQKPPRSGRVKRMSKGDSWLTNPYQKQKLTTKGDPRLYAKDYAPASHSIDGPSMTADSSEPTIAALTFLRDASSTSSPWIEAPRPKFPLGNFSLISMDPDVRDECARLYAIQQQSDQQMLEEELLKQAIRNVNIAKANKGLGMTGIAGMPISDGMAGSSITRLPRPPPPLPLPQLFQPYQQSSSPSLGQPPGSAYPSIIPTPLTGGSRTDKEGTMPAISPAGSYRFPSPHPPTAANIGGPVIPAGMVLPSSGPTYSPPNPQMPHAYPHPPPPPLMPPLPPQQQPALIIAQPPTPLPQQQLLPQPAANLPVAAAHTVESSHYPPGTVVYLPVITVLPGSSNIPTSTSTTPTLPAQQYAQFHPPPIPGSAAQPMSLYSHVQPAVPLGIRVPPPPPPPLPHPTQMEKISSPIGKSPEMYDNDPRVPRLSNIAEHEWEDQAPAHDAITPLPDASNFAERYTSGSQSRRGSLASSASSHARPGWESRGDQQLRGRSRSPTRRNRQPSDRRSERSRSREHTSRRR